MSQNCIAYYPIKTPHPTEPPPPPKWQGIFNIIWNKYALIGVIPAGFYWLLFAWSIQFLDIAIASIIVGLIFVVYTIPYYIKNLNWLLIKSTWALLLLFIVGIIIILSLTLANLASYYKGLLILILCITSGVVGLDRSIKWAERMNRIWQKKGDKAEPIDFTEIQAAAVESEKIGTVFGLLGIVIGLMLSLILTFLGSLLWILQGNTWDISFASNSIGLFTNKIVIINTVAWIICIMGGFVTAIGAWSFILEGLKVQKKAKFYLKADQISFGWVDMGMEIWQNMGDVGEVDFQKQRWRWDGDRIRSNINHLCIYCLTPVLSLVWLFPFGLAHLQRPDYLLLGVLIILTTSILIPLTVFMLGTETRTGLRYLIVSLWSIGTLIYFREKWIQWPWLADDTPWEWSIGSVDYYSLIVLTATIFILIYSFRYNRLVERTNREEEQWRRIDTMIDKLHISLYYTADRNLIKDYIAALKRSLRKIDKGESGNTWGVINELKFSILISPIGKLKLSVGNVKTAIIPDIPYFLDNFLFKGIPRLPGIAKAKLSDSELKDLEKLSDLQLEFDVLYRSKQRGKFPAENLILYTFSLTTIMITISTRPAITSHWNALLIDILAFLFSSAIMFMTINLIDLRAYREKSTEELTRIEGTHHIEAENPGAVQIISIILAVVISTSFLVLLYDKWMGIWFL